MKGMCSENYKAMLKDTNKFKHIPDSCTKRLSNVQMSIMPKVTDRVNAIPIETPVIFFKNDF